MRIGQVSVHFTNKHSSVLVTNPSSDRHEVNTGHDSVGDEIVAEMMEAELDEAGGLPGTDHTLSKGGGLEILFSSLRTWEHPFTIRGLPRVHLLEDGLELRIKINRSGFPILA